MDKLQYKIYHENKIHTPDDFPYNTYLCSIPLDFQSVNLHWHDEVEIIVIKKGSGIVSVDYPARNYWTEKEAAVTRTRAFNFTPDQVWHGLLAENSPMAMVTARHTAITLLMLARMPSVSCSMMRLSTIST